MHRTRRTVVIDTDMRDTSAVEPGAFGADGRGVKIALLRSLRPSSSSRESIGLAVVVGGISVLTLAVATGLLPALAGLGLAAAFALGAACAPLFSRPQRRRDSELDGGRHSSRVFDHLPVATLVARASDLDLVYASREAARLLGLPHEPRGRLDDVWNARLHEPDRERVLDDWRAWSSGARVEPFRSHYRLVTPDGSVVWVEDVTVHDAESSTLRRHLRDVTRERQLEHQLRQAQRLALLGRLAAGVAHDFNNLLAVISGYAARLATPLPRHAREESTLAIAGAADRGASLVRQLLAFSRPQSADGRVVDLNELVREFAPMVRRVIGEDIEFELRLDSHRLLVNVQPVEIDQVLMNVAVNARDAMPNGGRLTIGTWKLDDVAIVTVADTGVGMDAATQERIFEPFYSTKGPAKGSGLGLATAERIVIHAGGSMTVSSAPGEGATFSINLPFAANADAPRLLEAVADPAVPGGGAETVLVVEDEPALRELEKIMLEEAGYDVLTAANADEALLVVADHVVDLLVVDVVMPGMSGPRLVEELARRGSDLPTVFVSGYGADEVSSRGLMKGKTALIEKPFQPEQLLRRVREVLDDASQVVPRADASPARTIE